MRPHDRGLLVAAAQVVHGCVALAAREGTAFERGDFGPRIRPKFATERAANSGEFRSRDTRGGAAARRVTTRSKTAISFR